MRVSTSFCLTLFVIMPHFQPSFIKFFEFLEKNNNKTWFEENKSTFEKEVKKPFEQWVESLIQELKKTEDLGDTIAKDCIFRIYKDVRFSKDKTPYKTQMSALITKGGRKAMNQPGLYIELSNKGLNIYTGSYMPEKNELWAIRSHIVNNLNTFDKIINEKSFLKNWGEVKGEKNKILTPEFKEAAAKQPLVYNKQFYLLHQAEPSIIISDKLNDYILSVFSSSLDYRRFLENAISATS